MAWLGAAAAGWNREPTPFEWGGKQRRGGSGRGSGGTGWGAPAPTPGGASPTHETGPLAHQHQLS